MGYIKEEESTYSPAPVRFHPAAEAPLQGPQHPCRCPARAVASDTAAAAVTVLVVAVASPLGAPPFLGSPRPGPPEESRGPPGVVTTGGFFAAGTGERRVFFFPGRRNLRSLCGVGSSGVSSGSSGSGEGRRRCGVVEPPAWSDVDRV